MGLRGLQSGRIGVLGRDERFKEPLGGFLCWLKAPVACHRNVHAGVCAGCGEMPRLPGIYA